MYYRWFCQSFGSTDHKLEQADCMSESFEYFCPNVITIDPCNFELYRFKVGAFSETQ